MNAYDQLTQDANLVAAAKYFIQYCGQRGTDKQVAKLIQQMGPLVYKLAGDRGYKAEAK